MARSSSSRSASSRPSEWPTGFDYAAYLESDVWKARRKWKLEEAGHRCQLCDSTHRLDVHHRTYERIGDELQSDLIVLCRSCHKLHHGIEDEPKPDPVVLCTVAPISEAELAAKFTTARQRVLAEQARSA